MGQWKYVTGSYGTVNLQGKRLFSIEAKATENGTVNIDSMGDIPISNDIRHIYIEGYIENAIIVFSNTNWYMVQYLE